MRARWCQKDFTNFMTFFQEPWVELIMNDHIEELELKTREIIEETACAILDLNVERSKRKEFLKRYLTDVGATKEIHDLFLQFLRLYRDEFVHEFALPEDYPQRELNDI